MTFKILSLDGGGTWALLQAMALHDLYPEMSGLQILGQFDLAVANSGGSIVLAGLMLDMTPARIRSIFEDAEKRRSIFRRKFLLEFARYSTEEKRIGLHRAMGPEGDIPLADWPARPGWPIGPGGSPTRVVMTAFNFDTLREDLLRTYSIPATGAVPDTAPLADAVSASTNAPIKYFDMPAVAGDRRYWDGAMGGYNNPLLAGIVDALVLGVAPADIAVLTLGTGTVRLLPADLAQAAVPPPPADVVARLNQTGLLATLEIAASVIVDDPPDAATYIAHVMLGHTPAAVGNVVRLSPVVRPVLQGTRWNFPAGLSPALFNQLASLDMDAVNDADVEAIRALGAAWLAGSVPNQPIRMRHDFSAGPGDDTYRAGADRWLALSGAGV